MDRVLVSELSLGRKLNRPMYARTGRLLLSEDNALTRSMKNSLMEASVEYVYLGEWNPEEVARFESACADYRQLSTSLMSRLARDIEAEIAELGHVVEPSGVPLRQSIASGSGRQRTRAEIVKVERDYETAMSDAKAAVGGGLSDEQLGGAAERVVLTVMKRVKTDLDLLLHLVHRKKKDSYFEQHALNTVVLSMSIATAMGFSEDQVTQLGIGALFKDIGMRQAPQEIVRANRRITPSEHVDIQKHTIAGLNTIQRVRGLPAFARFLVYQHHERMDGKGYPKGRRKSVIHTYSKIVSVADAYDSLTSPRPWRVAIHPYRAMEQLIRGSEVLYDNVALRGLLEYLSLFPVGSLMHLATGDVVRVIANNPGQFHHPVVLVVRPEPGSGLELHQIIDLSEDRQHALRSPYEGTEAEFNPMDSSTEESPDLDTATV